MHITLTLLVLLQSASSGAVIVLQNMNWSSGKSANSPASTVIAYKLGKQSEVSSFVVLFLAISFSLAYALQLCLC